jgi:putative hydrolase of the HAD superfamily
MNVVFDFGGVLFHWHPPTFLARIWPHRVSSAEAAQPVVREFFQAYGGDWGAFDQGLIDAPTVTQRIAERTGWPHAEVAQVVAAVPGELQLLQPTVGLIQELKQAGHRLFYLSNMPEPFADHLEQAHPLHEWFESGVFSGRVKQSKPDAEIFQIAEQRFGQAPQDLLFLDDHLPNIVAARARGWQALHFSSAEAARGELQALGLLA